MNAQMQFSMFTHAKCQKCEHLGKIETFNEEPTVLAKTESENGNIEVTMLNLKCPLCGNMFCEALFPNEIN